MKKLEKRGRQVYRLAAVIQWAAFKFLAVTTAIFIWVSFHGYFTAKVGPQFSAVLGIVAVFVMFSLIDKGLDRLLEFLADEKMNPTEKDGNTKARAWFFRIVIFLAVIRLAATGTTSLWGSFEIADYVTEKPDETHITEAMERETEQLDKSRTSLEKQLSEARRTEAQRVKNAKVQGHHIVLASLTHPDHRVNIGFQKAVKRLDDGEDAGWYWTTPKLRKYRDAYKKALVDSTALVSAELGKVSGLEASLLALNTDHLAKSQEVRDKLAAVAVKEVEGYEAKKARRTNFLLIADFLAVLFGLLAVWVKATYRAAVGMDSELEEKTLDGVLWAAVKKWSAAVVNWVEKMLGVDLDGDGTVGGVAETRSYETVRHSETVGAVASSDRRQIGFFGGKRDEQTHVSDSDTDRDSTTETVDKRDIARQLERARGTLRKYESRLAAGKVRQETYDKAKMKWENEINVLERLLNS